MKKSLSHLPAGKRAELACVVDVIRERVPTTQMVILFGSHARGDWVEDITTEGHITYEYKSDFDLLVIVDSNRTAAKTGLWHKVKKDIRRLRTSTWVTLIVHHIGYVNKWLSRGQYFFTDIKKEGILLYDSKESKLARRRKLDPAERAEIAKEDFGQWFKSAKEFLGQFETAFEKKWFKNAAFQLHQATERFYNAIILVFTGYKPKTHDLDTLSHLSAGRDPAVLPIFPLSTDKEKHRFDLLCRAYIDARYKKNYKITRADLEYLAERVKKLQRITKRICKKKIESFV